MKRAFGIPVPEGLGEICSPERCALVVYDMQARIVPQIEDGKRIIDGCGALLEAARSVGMRVYFTRHLFLPNSSCGTGQLRRNMIWQRKTDPAETKALITQGSAAWQIVPELTPSEDEVIIDKITMSAFESTFLNVAMRDAQLQSFIIAAIALEVGIEPTVRHGADLNFIPVVAADACGSRTEEAHARSIATVQETGEVIIASVAEMVSSLKGKRTRKSNEENVVETSEASRTDAGPETRIENNGPYVVSSLDHLVDWFGQEIPLQGRISLCRCGQSGNKPFCDGSHVAAKFNSEKDLNRVADKRDVYKGQQIEVFDNRGICAHSGFCTARLSSVFHVGADPFITHSGGRMDEIIQAVRACPSGALSYGIDQVEARSQVDRDRKPAIEVSKDGPYRVTGGVRILDESGNDVPYREVGMATEISGPPAG